MPYIVDERMIAECEAVGEAEMTGENEILG
jgi:hypothetical protein